jgi:hypothetical protein
MAVHSIDSPSGFAKECAASAPLAADMATARRRKEDWHEKGHAYRHPG